MLYNRRHTRMLDEFGGLWTAMPVFGFLFMTVAFASAGLPGLNGFVGEFNILLGSFRSNPVFAVLATTGIVVGAWYLLRAIREMLHGPLTKPENTALQDLSKREVLTLVPIVILFFVIGLFPNLFLSKINPSAEAVAAALQERPAVAITIDRLAP
jgi:NADH-quinone oxidoreductase subunit M